MAGYFLFKNWQLSADFESVQIDNYVNLDLGYVDEKKRLLLKYKDDVCYYVIDFDDGDCVEYCDADGRYGDPIPIEDIVNFHKK